MLELKDKKEVLADEIIYFIRVWLRDEPVRLPTKKEEFYKMLDKYDCLCDEIEDAKQSSA